MTAPKFIGNDASNKKKKNDTIVGAWSDEEHQTFLKAMERIPETEKTRWKLIAEMIPTRNPTQVRTHATKYFRTLARREKLLKASQEASKATINTSTEKKHPSLSTSPALSTNKLSSSTTTTTSPKVGTKRSAPSSPAAVTSPVSVMTDFTDKDSVASEKEYDLSSAADTLFHTANFDVLSIDPYDIHSSFLSDDIAGGFESTSLYNTSLKRRKLDDDKAHEFCARILSSPNEDDCIDWLLNFFEEPVPGLTKTMTITSDLCKDEKISELSSTASFFGANDMFGKLISGVF